MGRLVDRPFEGSAEIEGTFHQQEEWQHLADTTSGLAVVRSLGEGSSSVPTAGSRAASGSPGCSGNVGVEMLRLVQVNFPLLCLRAPLLSHEGSAFESEVRLHVQSLAALSSIK